MTDFLAIYRTPLGLQPALFPDSPPVTKIYGLVYLTVVTPDLEGKPLRELLDWYLDRKLGGNLPPRYQAPKMKSESGPTVVKLGERFLHPRRLIPDSPYDPADKTLETDHAPAPKRTSRRPVADDSNTRPNSGRPASSRHPARSRT